MGYTVEKQDRKNIWGTWKTFEEKREEGNLCDSTPVKTYLKSKK